MEDRVGYKMMQLDSIIIEKTRKKVGARKTKSVLKIRRKSNNFACIFMQTVVAEGWTPQDHRSSVQKTLTNKGLQMKLYTLSWQPPIVKGGSRFRLLSLHEFLGRHTEGDQSLHMHALGYPTGESRKVQSARDEEDLDEHES